MLKIFHLFESREMGCEFINLTNGPPVRQEPGSVPVYFDPYGIYQKSVGLEEEFLGIHVIRDPRDVIISGAHYHQKSTEAWLHAPREEFGGRTYQEAITRIPTEDRFKFEMEHRGASTIKDMLAWNYEDRRFMNLKYEELMNDTELEKFSEIFAFLQFSKPVTHQLLKRTRNVSLHTEGHFAKTEHVRSGAPAQWKREFRRRDGERFLELFGPALINLGYEEDDSWLDQLSS